MLNWFADDFDYRCTSDDNPELMNNIAFLSTLAPLTRELVESADFFVVLGDYIDQDIVRDHEDPETGLLDMPPDDVLRLATLHNVPLKVIRRRNPEFQQHVLHEEIDGWEPETEEYDEKFGLESIEPSVDDALAHACSLDESRARPADETPPKARFDLIEDLRTGYSADWFPCLADKRLRGYAKNLSRAIENGLTARALHSAISEARGRGVMSRRQVSRLWELFDMRAHQRDPRAYQESIERRIVRRRASQ
jgi:hypothetical protein